MDTKNYGFKPYSVLTDAQRSCQPLLEIDGTIIVPPYIDAESYTELTWAIHLGRIMFPDSPLKLRIAGFGGDADLAFAILSLIKADGNFEGHVLGGAHSSHAMIWLSCQKRYVYPYAMIGIHSVQEGQTLEHYTANKYRELEKHLQPYENTLAQILSSACAAPEIYTEEYWLEVLKNITPPLTSALNADILINRYGMGVAY